MAVKDPPLPRARPLSVQAAKDTQPGVKAGATTQACDAIVVVVDPGHGEVLTDTNPDNKIVDSGTTWPRVLKPGPNLCKEPRGVKPTHMEKDLALGVSRAIRDNLKGKPHIKDVVLTREGDITRKTVRYKWRKDVAMNNDARVFLSMHIETTCPNERTNGYIVYCYPGPIVAESTLLANAIAAKYKTIVKRDGGVKVQSTRMGLVCFGDPYPVRAAVLVETGVISNQGDRDKLTSQASQIGKEIAEGVAAYVKANLNALCGKPA
jgi:N-acetylmuramoyl-L-alanine amidase